VIVPSFDVEKLFDFTERITLFKLPLKGAINQLFMFSGALLPIETTL